MNHILVFADDFVANHTAVIRDHRFTHLCQQLKAELGDTVKVGMWQDQQGFAQVTELNDHSATLSLTLNQPPPPASPIKLVLAMPRPKVLRRVLRSAIENGIKEIYLINSWKVEKSYWQTPWLSEQSLLEINKEALSLAKDTMPANISIHKRFKPFVEDELSQLVHQQQAFVAHPSDTPCPCDIDQATWLALGPEGGFTEYEVEKLTSIGFTAVSLGQRILRVENAVSVAIGRLNPLF